ncbi:serine/threonine protein kinase [Streptomyces sp. A0958]|uniref:serine/threonine-protein kinase n=1 Tax=Streptomyces sp. A0958 TaxID=2563101 RepID=UPI00109E71C1|nr:serine/threonine-protein kinase [Streptomyces sp. A0958]THA65297.1 serine/threonine protein kinase [Streptomyces sp. A0958]
MAGARIEALGGDDPATLGPYRLLGRLASGGMGRIYLARGGDRGLVAVKTLLAEARVSETDRRRFAREVTLAQRMDSAFTARVRDADPDARWPWMAIDYIAAPPLSELVRSCGVLPASAVRWIAAGTAQALATLHEAGIVHRDVKPQNVLLPLDGPRVIDFGISHTGDLTLTGLTLGTIAFTSPEQARGEESTAASDVYSLGATLFLLATGRPPYRSDGDTLRLLARVQRGQLDLTGLPKELVATVRPCLAVQPRHRPSLTDLLARFRAQQAGLPPTSSGTRWLPPRWTALIDAYAAQGREWANGRSTDPAGAAPTLVQRTRPVPQPPPTLVHSPERRARAERDRTRREMAALAELAARQRAEQAEREQAEREQAELHARRQAERAERERAEAARREARQAERQRAEEARREAARQEAARREAARREAERAERARAAQERADRERAEQERAALQRAERERAARRGAARPRTASPTPPGPGAPSPRTGSSAGAPALGWLLAVAAVIALLAWQPWEKAGGDGGGGRASGTTASGSVTSGSDLDTHGDDRAGTDADADADAGTGTGTGTDADAGTDANAGTDTDAGTGTDADSDSDSDSDSDDSETEEPTPTPTPTPSPKPTMDATDRAFAAVHAGDCLNVYNDGHDHMSAGRPTRVSCSASNAYMHVNRVSTRSGASSSCDTGAGYTWWSRTGGDGVVRTLCLDRVYRAGQCFPAEVNGATNADLTVVWSCGASKVPKAGQSILRITGFYRAPKAGRNWTCPAGPGERFWYWQVNQGRSIICASAA